MDSASELPTTVVVPNMWSVAIAVAICAVVTYGLNVVERWKLRHLPGPAPTIFIGNLSRLRGRNTWDVYTAWTRKYGRIYRWFQGRQPMVTISDPDLVKEVLLTKFQTFHNRELPKIFKQLGHGPVKRFKANMVFAQDKDWASVRSAVMPFFHSKELSSYCSDMNLSISRLSGILEQHSSTDEPADMRKYCGALALEVVGTAAFGIDFNTQSKTTEDPLVEAVTRTIKPNPTILQLGAAIQTFPFLTYLVGLVIKALPIIGGEKFRQGAEARIMPAATTYMLLRNAERKLKGQPPEEWGPTVELPWGEGTFETSKNKYKDATPKEGSLPDLLIKGKHKSTGEKLTPVQMVAQTAVFLLAGYDTTANTLSYCLWLLSRHPEEQEKVIAEVDSVSKATGDLTPEDLAEFPYTRAVVDEALRMYPPAPATGRIAKTDATIGGAKDIHIPAGTSMLINIMGMHFDPELFPEPEVFRPSRFLKDSEEAKARHPYAYLPFGAGPRMCIGYKFALQEIMLTMISTLRNYTFSPDPSRDQAVMKSSGLLTMGPAEGVWLKVSARGKTAQSCA